MGVQQYVNCELAFIAEETVDNIHTVPLDVSRTNCVAPYLHHGDDITEAANCDSARARESMVWWHRRQIVI